MLARVATLVLAAAVLTAGAPLPLAAQPVVPEITAETVSDFEPSADAAPAQADAAPGDADAATALAVDGPRRSKPVEADGPFSMVALRLPAGASASLRTSTDGQDWSDWRDAESLGDEAEGPDPSTPEDRAGGWTRRTQPMWVGEASWLQVRVGGASPADVEATLIDSAGLRRSAVKQAADRVAAALRPAPAAAADAPFPYVSRRGWGANESLRRRNPSYAKAPRFGVLHHTAGSNDYGPDDGPAVVRGIYYYHAVTLGWNDIGYNLLVDRFGRIYEGRHGGIDRAVIGAHAQGFNATSFGVSVMGNFSSRQLPSAAMRSLARVFAWKFELHGIDPRATFAVTSGGSNRWRRGASVTVNAISGHRDLGLTSCPGTQAYGQLRELRQRVAEGGAGSVPAPRFADIDGSSHSESIQRLALDGVTAGCSANAFCPSAPVTRGQMASFLARAGKLTSTTPATMDDVARSSPHATAVAAVVDAGIAAGYRDGTFRPAAPISRGQMASMLARALHLDPVAADRFDDTAGSVHRQAINAAADAEVTKGCDDGRFCPTDEVTRGQMATFLDRSRGAGLGKGKAVRFAAEAPGTWRVTKVRSDDTLNVRRGPTTAYGVVGELAPDATRIRSTGRFATVGTSTWRQLVLRDGTRGWANSYYLAH